MDSPTPLWQSFGQSLKDGRSKRRWQLQVTLKQIETFIRLAAVGNFRRVAEMMNTTQPNISNRISQLEETLGQALFERNTGSVTLTREGRGILPYAETLMKAHGAFIAAGSGQNARSVLRLGVAEMVAHSWLHIFLKEMRTRYPNVQIELEVNRSLVLEQRINSRDLDLAFMNGPIAALDTVNIEMGAVPFLWVAAPEVVQQLSPSPDVEELASLPLLTPGEGSKPHMAILERFSQNTRIRARIVPSNTIGACMKMAQSGWGIACLPEPFLTEALASGVVKPITPEWTPPPLGFTASYLRSGFDPVVQAAAQIGSDLVDWSA